MYGQIHAVSDVNDSTGKTMRVWSDADRINFSIVPQKKLLEISASCYHETSSGERGGEYIAINRTFLLQLEKEEVEKLVFTALNKKLLKKLQITNLQNIDLVGKLELDIEGLKTALAASQREVKRLNKIIGAAQKTLAEA